MNMSYYPMGIYFGTAILVLAAIYRYGIKRDPPNIGYIMQLIVYSYIVANGLLLMIKGVDFALIGSSFLGTMTLGEIKGIAIIGSLSGIVLLCYLFWKFLKPKGKNKKKQ